MTVVFSSPRSERATVPPNPLSDESVIDLVMSRYKHSNDSFSTFRNKLASWYDLYRMHYTGAFEAHRNLVAIPLVFSTIQSDVARKLSTLMGVWPIVGMFGYGPEDVAAARKNELLISAQMKDSDSYVKGYDFLLGADIYGTGVCQTGWRYDEETMLSREAQAAPVTGALLERLRTERTTTFDGPDWEVFDLLDYFPQPGRKDVGRTDWQCRRRWEDLDDCRELARAGIYESPSVKRLEVLHSLSSAGVPAADDRRPTPRNIYGDMLNRLREKYARPIEIIEMWGKVPSEFVPADGGTRRVITIGNGRVVLRNAPNPHWHSREPFLTYSPMRDPHSIFGQAKAEVCEKLQYTANKIACKKLDALDLFVDPQFYANRSAGIDRRNMRTKPGGVIWGDLPPAEAIQALVPNMDGVKTAYAEIQDLWRWIQQATGIIEDTVMGVGSSARTTAREFLGRQENVSVRLLLEARMAEEMWLEPLAQTFRALNRQFLPVPKQLKVLGLNAIFNPVTGEPIPQEELPVEAEDLYRDYDVRAMGSTQALGKDARRRALAELFQMTSTHPAGMALINWAAFFREMFLAYEVYNHAELLQPPPGQLGLLQQAGMAGKAGASPLGGPPEQGEGGGGPPVDLAAGMAGLSPLMPAA